MVSWKMTKTPWSAKKNQYKNQNETITVAYTFFFSFLVILLLHQLNHINFILRITKNSVIDGPWWTIPNWCRSLTKVGWNLLIVFFQVFKFIFHFFFRPLHFIFNLLDIFNWLFLILKCPL